MWSTFMSGLAWSAKKAQYAFTQKGDCIVNCFFFLFQANGTFDALAKLKEIADLWDQLGPRVWDFLQNSTQVNTIRVRLCTELQYNKMTQIKFFLFILSITAAIVEIYVIEES